MGTQEPKTLKESRTRSVSAIEEQPLFQFDLVEKTDHDQDFYDQVKTKFREERDTRLEYRPEGLAQYTTDLTGELARYEADPYAETVTPREPLNDSVEVLIIGGGFSALLTSARLREVGVESIRIVERGTDVGGTWYWNRYPGIACDVPAYDYLPLLDEMKYIPKRRYAGGEEIFAHCQAIAKKYELYDLAIFQTTVTSTVWNPDDPHWQIETDRGDHMRARFVICANGTLAKPKLARIQGMESFRGHSFHTSRWDYAYTGDDLSNLANKTVGIIGTGASAVQAVSRLGQATKELYVFQRTPSSIDFRRDFATDPEWAKKLKPGWQAKRREISLAQQEFTPEQRAQRDALPVEEKVRRLENANIDAMMKIHERIDEIVENPETADSLKPWYMMGCKRPCFDNNYLPTFNLPNVHLVDTKGKGITEINERGPVFDGKQFELDVLIHATGFEPHTTGIYNQILGRDGIDLQDKYSSGIRTLLGVHSHGYPNLFVMGGYQASFRFNLTDVLNVIGGHIAACVDYTRSHRHQSLDVTTEAEDWWVQEVIDNRGKTSRSADCTPGYYNFEGQKNRRQDGHYNGSYPQYIRHLEDVETDLAKHFNFDD